MVARKKMMDEKLLNRNKNIINHGFRKLEIWQLAIENYKFVHENLANHETIQMRNGIPTMSKCLMPYAFMHPCK
jgi:hypothetical protein